MKVLVVSDGKHELGPDSDQGALVELTRRLMDQNVVFVRDKVSDPKVKTHCPRGKTAAYEKRASGWIRYAQREGFDALILVIDLDGYKDRIIGIEKAQNDERLTFPRAMTVAIQKFDAWMLADEVALSKVLDVTVQQQPDPELINEPKDLCKKIRDESPCDFSLTEFYFQIAKAIDLDTLQKRCPKGFDLFRTRVEELFTN